jgi:hypothetical protein
MPRTPCLDWEGGPAKRQLHSRVAGRRAVALRELRSKPDAPSEIRGEFKAISTKVPGIQFSECVPKLAAVADKFTVVRSICHKDPNHGGGNHYMMTGMPTPVPVACGAFVTFHPSYGSMVSYSRGIRNGLPAYFSMPEVSRSGGRIFSAANTRRS